jgi:hypothetical protein
MRRSRILSALVGTFIVGACAVIPPKGPSVVALPPQGKNISQFQQEDGTCRQYAAGQIGSSTAAQTAAPSTAGNTAASVHNTNTSTAELQWRYDVAYMQCMAASGNPLQSFPRGYAASYPYDYAYADPAYYGPWYDPWFGPIGGVGFVGGFGHRFRHDGFHHGGFTHGGFAHGGFAHGGSHGR